MDRHLKERLVGAAVLVAAAIILIPEMLSGPRDSAPVQSAPAAGSADASGVKTYTIDLGAAKPQAAEQTATSSAQSFVETPPAPSVEARPESARDPASVEPATKQPEIAPSPQEKSKPARESAETEKPVAEKIVNEKAHTPAPTAIVPSVSVKAVNNDKGLWAVQVASFGVRATSERIAGELKAKGYPAFVAAFAANGQTLYRVRVGPVEDRAAAEALLKKIKPLHPDAAVAPQ